MVGTALLDALRAGATPEQALALRFNGESEGEAAGYTVRLDYLEAGAATALRLAPRDEAMRVLEGRVRLTELGRRDFELGVGLVMPVRAGGVWQLTAVDGPAMTLHVGEPAARAGVVRARVVIVGGGFSGAALAYHLLRTAPAGLAVEVVERGPWLGRGVAYGVHNDQYRLNVPASRMSLDPRRPADFVEFAGAEASPHAFLPRARYADYVVTRLREAVAGSAAELRVRRGDAVAVEPGGVRLADGALLPADAVVLATGLEPRIAPPPLGDDERVIDAWNGRLDWLYQCRRLLVLGAGLSALDVLAVLGADGFDGEVVVLSRHGLLPRAHLEPFTPAPPLAAATVAAAPARLLPLLRWGRRVIADAVAAGAPWQHAVDALRAHVPALWAALPPADRARFVRRVRPLWDVLRHRAPQESLARVERWRAAGRLTQLAGEVVACTPHETDLTVTVRLRGGEVRHERFDAVVRCIGPAISTSDLETPLVRALLSSGLATRDPAGIGIVTDAEGRVVGPDAKSARASPRLFALGALRRAAAWETTAVPEIAAHAARLAALLATA